VRHQRLSYDAGAEEDPEAAVCEYCGRPFPDEELLALHHGTRHREALTDDQQDAYEAAYEDEQEDVRLFRLKALGGLVLVYFLFLMVYAVV
jgi:hypothetical protein